MDSQYVFRDKSAQDVSGLLDTNQLRRGKELTVYVEFGAGTSAGQVLVEAAHDKDYAGLWSVLATINWAAASREHHAAITGVHAAVRVRIASAIVGGLASAYYVGV